MVYFLGYILGRISDINTPEMNPRMYTKSIPPTHHQIYFEGVCLNSRHPGRAAVAVTVSLVVAAWERLVTSLPSYWWACLEVRVVCCHAVQAYYNSTLATFSKS